MRRTGRVALGSLAVAIGLVAYAPGALGLPADPTDSPTWVTFDSFDYALANATQVFIQGSKVDDGCTWIDAFEAKEFGEGAIEGREVGIDTESCLVLMEYGVPPAWAVRSAFGHEFDGVGPPSDDTSGLGEPDGLLAEVKRGVAAFKVAWEDPFGIDVNSVTAQTDWHWNGNCVVAPVDNDHDQDWFTPSGWFRIDQNFVEGSGCTQTTASSFAHFGNDDFCPGGGNRTHAWYDRVIVHGRYNGNATKSHNSWVSGGCDGLLSKVWIFCVDSPVGGDTDCTTSF